MEMATTRGELEVEALGGGEKRGGSSQLLLLLKGQAQVCVEPYASMKNRRGGEIKF